MTLHRVFSNKQPRQFNRGRGWEGDSGRAAQELDIAAAGREAEPPRGSVQPGDRGRPAPQCGSAEGGSRRKLGETLISGCRGGMKVSFGCPFSVLSKTIFAVEFHFAALKKASSRKKIYDYYTLQKFCTYGIQSGSFSSKLHPGKK